MLRWARPRVLPALLALVFVFTLPYLAPEGLRDALLGPHASEPSAIARLEDGEHLGLPGTVRFVPFVAGVVHGDFGRSYVQPVDVEREVAKHARLTAALVALALVVTRNRFGPAVVFGVLAVEAVLGWAGLGRLLASAVEVRDLVMVRAVLAVVLLGCVALPRSRRRAEPPPLAPTAAAVGGAWAWLFGLALVVAFAQRLPVPHPAELAARRAAPSLSHWLGTDDVGRDLVARFVWGAQGTLLMATAAAVAGGIAGMVAGLLGAEAPRMRRAYAWIGIAGIPAIGVSVGLAAVLSRDPFVMWQWLVPVSVGPTVAWATIAFSAPDGPGEGGVVGPALGAVGCALANAIVAEAVLGALGCTPTSTITWGSLLDDVRVATSTGWLELVLVTGGVVATAVALRTVASALQVPSRRVTVARTGTMAP